MKGSTALQKHDLESELAIRNLAARYSLAVTCQDYATLKACFAEDATWKISGALELGFEGREAIVDFIQKGGSGLEFIVQLVSGGLIEVTNDTGGGQWSINEMGRSKDGAAGFYNMGVYRDRYRRDNGIWRFTSRHYSVIYWSNAVPDGNSFPVDHLRAFGDPDQSPQSR